MPALRFAPSDYVSPAHTPGLWARCFPSLNFYARAGAIIYRSAAPAKAGTYTGEAWANDSLGILRAVEYIGGRVQVEGTEHFHQLEGPCLFVGNHMSTLETFLLPAIIQPWKPVTFVIKQSLCDYPFFGPIICARNPIVVGRSNPREDLTAVLGGGQERLAAGLSLVIFPQSTRTNDFDPKQFNTIGIKLARKAGVPVVPLALRTDLWSNGRLIKDLGPIRPERRVHIRFGAPMTVQGTGKEEHAAICTFIQDSLHEWRQQAG